MDELVQVFRLDCLADFLALSTDAALKLLAEGRVCRYMTRSHSFGCRRAFRARLGRIIVAIAKLAWGKIMIVLIMVAGRLLGLRVRRKMSDVATCGLLGGKLQNVQGRWREWCPFILSFAVWRLKRSILLRLRVHHGRR